MSMMDAFWDKQVDLLILSMPWQSQSDNRPVRLMVFVKSGGTTQHLVPYYLTWFVAPPNGQTRSVVAIPAKDQDGKHFCFRIVDAEGEEHWQHLTLSASLGLNGIAVAKASKSTWAVTVGDSGGAHAAALQIKSEASTVVRDVQSGIHDQHAAFTGQALEFTDQAMETSEAAPDGYASIQGGGQILPTYHAANVMKALAVEVRLNTDGRGVDIICPNELRNRTVTLSWRVIPYRDLIATDVDEVYARHGDKWADRQQYTPQEVNGKLIIHLDFDWSDVRPLSRILIMQPDADASPIAEDVPKTNKSWFAGNASSAPSASPQSAAPLNDRIVFTAEPDAYGAFTYREHLFCAAYKVDSLSTDRVLAACFPLGEEHANLKPGCQHDWATEFDEFVTLKPTFGEKMGYTSVSLYAFYFAWSAHQVRRGPAMQSEISFEDFVQNPNRLLLASMYDNAAIRHYAESQSADRLISKLLTDNFASFDPNVAMRAHEWYQLMQRETSGGRSALRVMLLDLVTWPERLQEILTAFVLPEPRSYSTFAQDLRELVDRRESLASVLDTFALQSVTFATIEDWRATIEHSLQDRQARHAEILELFGRHPTILQPIANAIRATGVADADVMAFLASILSWANEPDFTFDGPAILRPGTLEALGRDDETAAAFARALDQVLKQGLAFVERHIQVNGHADQRVPRRLRVLGRNAPDIATRIIGALWAMEDLIIDEVLARSDALADQLGIEGEAY